jgi:hypothetical protein
MKKELIGGIQSGMWEVKVWMRCRAAAYSGKPG